MNRQEIIKTLSKLTEGIDLIADQKAASILKVLLNLVEVLSSENETLSKVNQDLKDEINRLKGEQGIPDIREQKNDDPDHSSESDRKKRNKKPKRKPKKKKKQTVKVDRSVLCDVDKKVLPEDAKFKGYKTVIVQDIQISTDNIEFKRAIYYSRSLNKTFSGSLPEAYDGEFGPGVKALVITLSRDSGMTEPSIKKFLNTFNIDIAKSTISRILTEKHDVFHQEKEDIISAGLGSTPYQHTDDTGCRVNGKNHYTHILCNPYYTAFFTMRKKSRLTVLKMLCQTDLQYRFNNESLELMSSLGLSEKQSAELKKHMTAEFLSENEVDKLLEKLFPNPKKQQRSRDIILEAGAITYYKHSDNAVQFLICDDAPQFNKIAEHKGLCWIHEGRHYKKLNPLVELHRNELDNFINQFWDFYQELKQYKQHPTTELAEKLSAQFDTIFSTKTGYDDLDKRIAMTLAKKNSLLLALEFPFLPLHNNSAELGARVQARIRDIHLQTKSANGTKAKDTFATIVQTARKLGVNVYKYIYDRVSKTFQMSSLAELISEQSNLSPDTS